MDVAIKTRGNVGSTQGTNGLLRVLTPAEVTQEANDAANPVESSIPGLVAHIDTAWERNKTAKREIEEEMLAMMRQRRGIYDAKKLAEIRETGGSEGFDLLTDTKCNTAIQWINDIMFPAGERPWEIKPTPIPEIDQSVAARIMQTVQANLAMAAAQKELAEGGEVDIQQLKQVVSEQQAEALDYALTEITRRSTAAAGRIEKKIEDQLVEGKFYEEVSKAIDDVVSLKAGFIRGPIFTRKKKRVYVGGSPMVTEELKISYKRLSPFDVYPAPGSMGINDDDLILRHRMTRKELSALVGVPGYSKKAIRSVLEEHGVGGLSEWLWTDTERESIRKNPYTTSHNSGKVDALEFMGSVQGKLLIDMGFSAGVEDPMEEYEVNIWKIGRHIIRAVLNPDVLGDRQISKASYREDVDGFWGYGLPERIKHDQDAANATYRAINNNSAMAAGPLVEENVQRLAPGEQSGEVYPFKVYKVTDDQMLGAPAVRFHNTPYNAHFMVNVLRFFNDKADDHSGVPAYAHGNENVGGAGNTKGGLAMLMGAATKGMKGVVKNIDVMIRDVVERTYHHNRINGWNDPYLDAKVAAKGATAMIVKEEMLMRRREMLATTANPVDLQIVGMKGREHQLRETYKDLGFDVEKSIQPDMPAPQLQAPPEQGAQNANV